MRFTRSALPWSTSEASPKGGQRWKQVEVEAEEKLLLLLPVDQVVVTLQVRGAQLKGKETTLHIA